MRRRKLMVLLAAGAVAALALPASAAAGATAPSPTTMPPATGHPTTTAPITTTPTTPLPPGVRHLTLTFVDRSRPTKDPDGVRSAPSRTLATEVYLPRGKGPFPLVVFAHGNAGHPLKLTEMLSAWAAAGYVVAAPAFPLTNDRSGGPSIIGDYANQPADVSFVISRMLHTSTARHSPLHGRIDARHIGLAGHSLGGATVYGVRANTCCIDRRVDAVILMDAVRLPFSGADRPVRGPVLFVHIDTDPVVPYSQSQTSYAAARPPKYLMTLHGGVHAEPYEDTPSPHDHAVIAATTQFWNAYLRGRRAAARRIIPAGTEPGLSSVVSVLR